MPSLFWPDERQAVNMDTQRFEAVICGGLFLTTPIERFPALKCIQVTSAGLDRVPLDYCKHTALSCIRRRRLQRAYGGVCAGRYFAAV